MWVILKKGISIGCWGKLGRSGVIVSYEIIVEIVVVIYFWIKDVFV